MPEFASKQSTAFEADKILMRGSLAAVALAVKHAAGRPDAGTLLTFDDATGAVIDLDLRGSDGEIVERLERRTDGSPATEVAEATIDGNAASQRARGRPKLGVVSREVTLLPRHWDWLATQPGGASVALRRLVEQARRTGGEAALTRVAQEAAYRFMSAMAGNLPGFEEAARALFAGNRARFKQEMASWPSDLRDYALRLADGARLSADSQGTAE